MGVEQITDLHRRARIHAALSDPARLLIVDTLRLGDASPSDLAAALDMPSNLLAHHLNVLKSEGLIVRTRSEGDRRRSYLRLNPMDLDGLTAVPVRRAARVLFVCTANSARSHLAAALWRRANPIPAASAGTHPAAQIDPGAVAVARRHGLALPRRRPQSWEDVRTDVDFVVTVCDSAHEEIGHSDLHWSVPDPVRHGSSAAFDTAYRELERRVEAASAHIIPCDR